MFDIKKEGHLSSEAKLLYNIWQELKELNRKFDPNNNAKSATADVNRDEPKVIKKKG